MVAARIQPSVVTYSTLISQATGYETAKEWFDKMVEARVQPNVFTYSTLFSKDLSSTKAKAILDWYLNQSYHPSDPLQAAISGFLKIHRLDDALYLSLNYPYLEASRKLFRKYSPQALQYLGEIRNNDSQYPNAQYALGIALFELGKMPEAEPVLQKALSLSTAGPRQNHIAKLLQQIEKSSDPRSIN